MNPLQSALPHAPTFTWDWAAIDASPLGPLLRKLAAVPQDPRWHAEGDVAHHTMLVCEALSALPEYRALPESQQQILALAALLHDTGKLPTTRQEGEGWVSPHHSGVGARMTRERLWLDLDLCGTPEKQRFRETVCLLVRHHMVPGHILDQQDPSRKLLTLAAEGMLCPDFTLALLCLLAEADVRGRIAPDREELLDKLDLCRQEAALLGCLTGPGHFADAHTRRAYFAGRSVPREVPLYNDTWGEVILLSGLPGTGKDTWIARHHPDLPVVSLDALRQRMNIAPTQEQGRIAQAAKEEARVHLRAHRPFLWNATNLTESTRGQLIQLFEDYGAAVRVVYLETAWGENLRRNADRTAIVPESVITGMLGKLTPPHAWEATWVEWQCV